MRKKTQNSKIKTQKLIIYLLIIFLFYFVFVNVKHSIIFKKRDRLNLVFYGEKTAFYSLGFVDNINYFIYFSPDARVLIPGGFGYYRLGALGKLVDLERKPDLIKKSFSATTGSFVNLYFYPTKSLVYFGNKNIDFYLPSIKQIFFTRSNGTFLDRIYISYLFFTRKRNDYQSITNLPFKDTSDGSVIDERRMFDKLIGYFYQKVFRDEDQTVQIVYTDSYKNSLLIGHIIEGQGIKVVDFTMNNAKDKDCWVFSTGPKLAQSTRAIADFFNCHIKSLTNQPYDIIFKLGEREKEWSVE